MIRPRTPIVLASLIFALLAGRAWAGASVCWIQNGVLLAPAVAAGVNGVFILDTGTARSQLDATQASEADIEDPETVGAVKLAGRTLPSVKLQVLALDDRTRRFPIPIAGVLGADVLAGQVLEVRPSPCRVRIWPSSRAERSGAPLTLTDGVPYVRASVSDGTRSQSAPFRIDTGSPAPVALDEAALAPSGRLRALSVGHELFEEVVAVPRPKTGDGASGAIGEPIWSRFRLRLDFGRGRLTLSPK